MKATKIFIKHIKNGSLKTFPLESYQKHKAALQREGWREATMEEINAAGYQLEPIDRKKNEKKTAKETPINDIQDEQIIEEI